MGKGGVQQCEREREYVRFVGKNRCVTVGE
jgi:hypothetical protein